MGRRRWAQPSIASVSSIRKSGVGIADHGGVVRDSFPLIYSFLNA
jgi:hypothetical protein